MDRLVTLFAFATGLILASLVLQDAFEVMLLPRRVQRRTRLVSFYFRASWRLWSSLGRRSMSLPKRERFLSLFGPISIVVLFVVWAATLIVSFGLMLWSLERWLPSHHNLSTYLYLSGVTFFTVGYGDLAPQTGITKTMSVVEAGTGLGLLAVVISYLPVLYQLVSRREAHIMQLDARASTPPTAGTLLSRHASNNAMPKLDGLLRDWERWCAELAESHLSYPMLGFYRSQHANQNWLAALTAIMDCCAIVMVGLKGVPSFQAKMTFSMARLAMVEMCRVFHQAPLSNPPDRVASRGFASLDEELKFAGLAWANAETAEQVLREFMATYDPFAATLAQFLLVDLPTLTAEEEGAGLDNWQRSARGRAAKSLVENAPLPDER